MERFWGVVEIVLPVIVIVLIGAFVRKKGMVTANGMGQIKAVLVNICLPAVLFNTFYAMDFTWKETTMFLTMSGATLAAFGLGFLAMKLFCAEEKIFPWLCTTIEGGSIGYALFILLYGQDNLFHLALLDAGNAVIQWSLVMTMLAMRTSGKRPLGETVKSLITPINVAIAAGLVCSITGIGKAVSASAPGQALEKVLDFVGTPVSAMIMMSVGFDLSFGDIRWKETLKAAGARAAIFAVLGIVTYIIAGHVFTDDPLYRGAVLIFFILPPTYAYTVYVKKPEESSFLGGFLAVYTLITIAAFAVVALLTGAAV